MAGKDKRREKMMNLASDKGKTRTKRERSEINVGRETRFSEHGKSIDGMRAERTHWFHSLSRLLRAPKNSTIQTKSSVFNILTGNHNSSAHSFITDKL
jgi:hypothetical protein